jgi:hypothetical protein
MMTIDYEITSSVLIALIGIGGGLFAKAKADSFKNNMLEFVGDLADFLAMTYAAMNAGTITDPAVMKKIGGKIEELWTDIQALGPAFEALLCQKSSLAESISKSTVVVKSSNEGSTLTVAEAKGA